MIAKTAISRSINYVRPMATRAGAYCSARSRREVRGTARFCGRSWCVICCKVISISNTPERLRLLARKEKPKWRIWRQLQACREEVRRLKGNKTDESHRHSYFLAIAAISGSGRQIIQNRAVLFKLAAAGQSADSMPSHEEGGSDLPASFIGGATFTPHAFSLFAQCLSLPAALQCYSVGWLCALAGDPVQTTSAMTEVRMQVRPVRSRNREAN